MHARWFFAFFRVTLAVVTLFSYDHTVHPDLHSFPTRRSSDLTVTVYSPATSGDRRYRPAAVVWRTVFSPVATLLATTVAPGDRKSTRLNSSHMSISYAVFCLKKKNVKRNCLITLRHSNLSTAA